jgi:hypothetical protein
MCVSIATAIATWFQFHAVRIQISLDNLHLSSLACLLESYLGVLLGTTMRRNTVISYSAGGASLGDDMDPILAQSNPEYQNSEHLA